MDDAFGHSLEEAFITCCTLFALYILCIAVNEGAFRYSNRRYTWIRRESGLLCGLIKDVEDVYKLELDTQKKERQLLGFEDGRTVPVLNGWEESWITTAKKVVDEANWCLQKLKQRREVSFPKWFLLVTLDLVPMVHATLRINKLNDFLGKKEYDVDLEMNKLICLLGKKKIGAIDIYRALEQSRSRLRSIQDRSAAGETKHDSKHIQKYCLRADELNSSLQRLIDGNPHLMRGMDRQIKSIMMHSHLLSAFMKDLKQLKGVETEMEKSWVQEAHETIMEATLVVDAINATANKGRCLSIFSDWMAKWKLQTDIMAISPWISGLLEIKERYGFKFVKRDSSISALRTPHHEILHYQTTDDVDLLFAVKKIKEWLNKRRTDDMVSHSQVDSLSKELDNMHKLFKDTKATGDSAIYLRTSCLEQLKKSAGEVQNPSGIHRIMEVVDLLQKYLTLYSIGVGVESSMPVVGLEEDVHELVLRLTAESSGHCITSIVGMEGIGKTTLARKVFTHSTTEDHFDDCLWVSEPQEGSNENQLLTIVGKKIMETQEKGDRRDYSIKEVKDFLKEKLCLLVFDKVSTHETMYIIKKTFPGMMKEGSRILLTTRNKAIASDADQNCKPHQLRLRTKEESWEIFTQMVDCPPEMETLAKEVVGRGGGLPLAILRLGYQMSGEKVTTKRLSSGHDCMKENQAAWSGNVKVNEEVLQFHPILSRCFSYFKRFPRDTEIPARRIVGLWIALGLVQQCRNEKKSLESHAYEQLMELIGRNLIQVAQRKPNGRVKTCCLPSSVLDHLLKTEGNINTRNARSWSSRTTSSDGQLAFHFHKDNDDGSLPNHGLNIMRPNFMQSESDYQSNLISNNEEGSKHSVEGETICRALAHGFRVQLQVLDLECVLRPQLPETIGDLKQLTYLGLRCTYLWTIPASIGNLVNLLTLDLKHTHLRSLPSSVWKLKKLRHLYLNQNCQTPQPTAIHMKNLQILSGVFVDNINLVKDRLDKLNNLRKLGLTFQVKDEEKKVLEAWIKKLKHLESLKLTIKDRSSKPQPLNLECIKDLNKLSSLYLFGRLDEKLPIIEAKLPQSLTHLTLSASGIRTDPMPMLGKLPNLKWLKLNSDSYHGTDMVCAKKEFPRLLVLRLWNLDTLKKLDVEKGSMINLMVLEMKSCRNLTVTTGLEHCKNLQKQRVVMPKKYTGDIQ